MCTGQLNKRIVRKLVDNTGSGYRLINLGTLQTYIVEISLHSATCKAALDYAVSNRKNPIVLMDVCGSIMDPHLSSSPALLPCGSFNHLLSYCSVPQIWLILTCLFSVLLSYPVY